MDCRGHKKEALAEVDFLVEKEEVLDSVEATGAEGEAWAVMVKQDFVEVRAVCSVDGTVWVDPEVAKVVRWNCACSSTKKHTNCIQRFGVPTHSLYNLPLLFPRNVHNLETALVKTPYFRNRLRCARH